MGFGQCFYSDGNDRGVLRDFNAGCNNGEYIANSYDNWRLEHVHNWPFASVGNATNASFVRTGTGLHLVCRNDGLTADDVLALSYAIDVHIDGLTGGCPFGGGNVHLSKLWADDVNLHTNSNVGILLDGNYDNVYIDNSTTGGPNTPLKINAGNINDRLWTSNIYINGETASATNDCVEFDLGTWFETGKADISRCGRWGVDVTSTNVRFRGFLNFHDMATSSQPCPVGLPAGLTSDSFVMPTAEDWRSDGSQSAIACRYGRNQLAWPTVASASLLEIPHNSDDVEVTGTKAVSFMSTGWTGRVVRLHFDDALRVNRAGPAASTFRAGCRSSRARMRR
jgi:hypothetical protein